MKRFKLLALGLSLGLVLSACGQKFQSPSIDETGNETGTDITPERNPADVGSVRTLSLDQATNVRKLVGGILEYVTELPPGSTITIPNDFQISQPSYRNSDGTTARSSTGFVGSVKIVATPTGANQLTAAQIATFNKLGLFVSASIVGASEGVTGSFKVIAGGAPGAGFSTLFASTGKPKFAYTAAVTKRFGSQMNKAIDPSSDDAKKYQKVFAELQRAADRKVETPKQLILIDSAAAKKYSIAYETNGTVAYNGAWSIAVGATAVRHGFANVPCAEFMSEMIREAYQRAGYSASTDFSAQHGDQLIWSKTASVQGLSSALHAAGWVAWEPSKFRPPTGAIMMHGSAMSPGHTFMAGGDDGQIVIDNGSPQGRDLRTTSASTLNLMYRNGVFFLPPGILPKAW
jgi:hypothetical protein